MDTQGVRTTGLPLTDAVFWTPISHPELSLEQALHLAQAAEYSWSRWQGYGRTCSKNCFESISES